MKYYKNKETGEVFAFELDGSQDHLISDQFEKFKGGALKAHLSTEPTLESRVFTEKFWRDSELMRADIELNKAQDGDGTGSVKAWREYRRSLRAYPTLEGFPDSSLRPVSPDSLTQ